ncbi:MAG: phosphatase PAP2 family protein [Phycisphaeraceae bacterium]
MKLAARLALFVAIGAVLIVAAHLVDRWAYDHVVYEQVYQHDWGRMFRIAGYLPTWLLVGAAILLLAWPRVAVEGAQRALAQAYLLVLSATAGGALAEVVKLLVRRVRPEVHQGAYGYRPWSVDPLRTGGLAMPSSHVLVAFAAAFMLVRLYPRAAPVWLIIGVGCALTRVLPQDHFVSDVTVAAVLGYAVAWGVAALAPKHV